MSIDYKKEALMDSLCFGKKESESHEKIFEIFKTTGKNSSDYNADTIAISVGK